MSGRSIFTRPLPAPRFSLRTLLLLIPPVALFLASAARELHEFRREQSAWSELASLAARRSDSSLDRRRWAARLLGPLLPEMDRITSIRLGFYSPRTLSAAELERAFELLQSFPRLRELSLRGLPITDAHLERLAGLPELVHLDLQATLVTDEGLARLDTFPSLLFATLAETPVTDAAIERLSDKTKARYWLQLRVAEEMRELVEIGPGLTPPETLVAFNRGYPDIPPPEQLQVRRPMTSAAFARLQAWPEIDRVRTLIVADRPTSAADLQRFAAWKEIEEFTLDSWTSEERTVDLAFAAEWHKLRKLGLSNYRVDAACLQALARCGELEWLHLASDTFDDAAAEVIVKQHPNLETLWLDKCQLTDRGLAKLATLPHLMHLGFQSRAVTDQGLAPLLACPHLRSLFTDWPRYRPETRGQFGAIAQ
jgi:hypothetical protein